MTWEKVDLTVFRVKCIILLIDGIASGCIYGLVALGFVLIYKATETINFAQGDILMLGAFVAFSGANAITGASSSAAGTPDATADSAVTLANDNTITFTDGYANPELQPDSGNIIYQENRKPISRATDQTEDIKIIVEF